MEDEVLERQLVAHEGAAGRGWKYVDGASVWRCGGESLKTKYK